MKHINNWKIFNEGIFSSVKKGVSGVYNFFKLVTMLTGWERKYTPDQYDKVISDAFELINAHNLQPGELSPPFTLPNNQLKEEFIKKFFKAAEENGYKVISKSDTVFYGLPPDEGYTTFNFKK